MFSDNNHFKIKDLADQTVANRCKSVDGSLFKWTKVHSFKYKKSEPNITYFKYNLNSYYNYIEISRHKLKQKIKL